ncbi:MAG: pentapeptide repeat-containing protein [Gloeomargaritaceae cyanobacterium C42_A2020_066]|nr:pentapeptide repeat-containing protein [Gloeomargaritaceae cyanobacterium C42_A2020_066]
MNSPSILQRAKQGDPEAIALLMNQALASQGVTARVVFRHNCLEVLLEAPHVPDRRASLNLIRQGLARLEIPGVATAKVYARRAEELFPDWMEAFGLEGPPTGDLSPAWQSQPTRTVAAPPPASPWENVPDPEVTAGRRAPSPPPLVTSDEVGVALETPAQDFLTRYARGERDFIGVKLIQVSLIGAILDEVNFQGADLSRAVLREVSLVGAVLREANLAGANLTLANLTEADLSQASLGVIKIGGQTVSALVGTSVPISANLKQANLTRATLTGADLTRAALQEATLVDADLSQAILVRANLRKANLSQAILNKADLTWADLSEATLTDANLSRTNLKRANLQGADLTNANLWYADLTEANLKGAKLNRANLTGANMAGAIMPDGRTKLDKRWQEPPTK